MTRVVSNVELTCTNEEEKRKVPLKSSSGHGTSLTKLLAPPVSRKAPTATASMPSTRRRLVSRHSSSRTDTEVVSGELSLSDLELGDRSAPERNRSRNSLMNMSFSLLNNSDHNDKLSRRLERSKSGEKLENPLMALQRQPGKMRSTTPTRTSRRLGMEMPADGDGIFAVRLVKKDKKKKSIPRSRSTGRLATNPH